MTRSMARTALLLVLCGGAAAAGEYRGTLTGLDNDGKSVKVETDGLTRSFTINEKTVFDRLVKGVPRSVPKEDLVKLSRRLEKGRNGPMVEVTTEGEKGKERLTRVTFTGPLE